MTKKQVILHLYPKYLYFKHRSHIFGSILAHNLFLGVWGFEHYYKLQKLYMKTFVAQEDSRESELSIISNIT